MGKVYRAKLLCREGKKQQFQSRRLQGLNPSLGFNRQYWRKVTIIHMVHSNPQSYDHLLGNKSHRTSASILMLILWSQCGLDCRLAPLLPSKHTNDQLHVWETGMGNWYACSKGFKEHFQGLSINYRDESSTSKRASWHSLSYYSKKDGR